MSSCPHKLPVTNGCSWSGMPGKPATVTVWCGRCKTSVPATLEWLERAEAKGYCSEPALVREIITTGIWPAPSPSAPPSDREEWLRVMRATAPPITQQQRDEAQRQCLASAKLAARRETGRSSSSQAA